MLNIVRFFCLAVNLAIKTKECYLKVRGKGNYSHLNIKNIFFPL